MESKFGRAETGLLNRGHQRWCDVRVICSPPFMDARIGVLARLEPGVRTERLCPFDSDRIRQYGRLTE